MKRMTLVFDEDSLYTAVKVAAAKRNAALKDLIPQILREWLEAQEDAELLPLVAEAKAEYEAKGGVEASDFFSKNKSKRGK
ncbi:MAG TPA: hypothetical protein PK747_02300 [Acidobacteriota bacterium]|nr:hypothetical protein [Acidobacteriota bacterium]HNT16879.1 hypothetical protein [Acidobacteriota bacterium]HQO19600.1 hypothetical protein [Acidobacteriota bacterium]HQQ46225.1 hypothetical protein [Acidobacteriota bacterium]